jgi:hypothetical protein
MGVVLAVLAYCSTLDATCGDFGSSLAAYEDKIYSQNGEDGVLLKLMQLVGLKSKTFVEFGVEDGTECNTRILRERLGMTGLLMDGGNENASINLNKEFITMENVLGLFSKYKVDKSFDVLSLDVDMFDLWILREILKEYQPRVMVVETNPTLGLSDGKFSPYDYAQVNAQPMSVVHPSMTNQTVWDLTRYSGANPAAFRALGRRFGYEMVYCERCGVNCFLVHESVLPQSCDRAASGMSLPKVSYPCFGTARTGGAYPGHEVDPQRRKPVKLSEDVIDAWLAGGAAESQPAAFWGAQLTEVFPYVPYALPSDMCSSSPSVAAAETALERSAAATGECKSRHFTEEACVEQADLYYELGLQKALTNDSMGALEALRTSATLNSRNQRTTVLAPLLGIDKRPLNQRVSLGRINIVRMSDEGREIKQEIAVALRHCADTARQAELICRQQGIEKTAAAVVEEQIRMGMAKTVHRALNVDLLSTEPAGDCLDRWIMPLKEADAHCQEMKDVTNIIILGSPHSWVPLFGEARMAQDVSSKLAEIHTALFESCPNAVPAMECDITRAVVTGDLADLDATASATVEEAIRAIHALQRSLVQAQKDSTSATSGIAPLVVFADPLLSFTAPLFHTALEGNTHFIVAMSAPMDSARCTWDKGRAPMDATNMLHALKAWERYTNAALAIANARDAVAVIETVTAADGKLNLNYVDQFLNIVRPSSAIATFPMKSEAPPRCASAMNAMTTKDPLVAPLLARLEKCHLGIFSALEESGAIPTHC